MNHDHNQPQNDHMFTHTVTYEKPKLTPDPKGIAGSKKCPLWLLPTTALRQTAWVLKTGADKYGPYNWRDNEVKITDYVSAIHRHLADFLDGSNADFESGKSELAHIAATCFILMDALESETLIDNRPKTAYQLSRPE